MKTNSRSTRNTTSRMLSATSFLERTVAIIKAQRIPGEEDELNIDLPAFFLYRPWMKDWLLIKSTLPRWKSLPNQESHRPTSYPGSVSWTHRENIRSSESHHSRDWGEDTPSGSWVRTHLFLINLGEDTLSAFWVRTPSRQTGCGHPAGNSLPRLVSETFARLELSTYCTTESELTRNRYDIKSSNLTADRQNSATYRLDYSSRTRSGHAAPCLDVHTLRVWAR